MKSSFIDDLAVRLCPLMLVWKKDIYDQAFAFNEIKMNRSSAIHSSSELRKVMEKRSCRIMTNDHYWRRFRCPVTVFFVQCHRYSTNP